jgi:hypothetical protein
LESGSGDGNMKKGSETIERAAETGETPGQPWQEAVRG